MDNISGLKNHIGNDSIRKIGIWADWIGWKSTCLFVFSAWISPTVGTIALFIMVAAMLIDMRNSWSAARWDPMFWFFLFFLGYIIFSAIYASLLFPDTRSDQWHGVWRYGQLFFFAPMAYWLKSDLNRIKTVLTIALVGLVISIVISYDWVHWQDILQGKRIFPHRMNTITFGFFAETALLGLLLIGFSLKSSGRSDAVNYLRRALWFILLAFFIQTVIFTQSRSAWIGMLLVYPPVIAARIWHLFKYQPHKMEIRWFLTSSAILVTAVFLILANSYNHIADRLGQEHDDFKRFVALETDGYNEWGFGVRVLLNIYGYRKWKERPILGWGPGTAFKPYNHAHLHNSYLEVLVRFGIVGATLFLVMLGLVFRALIWARARDMLPFNLILFLTGTFALAAIFCLTGYRLDKFDFRSFWTLLAGISYTFYLHRNNIRPGMSAFK